MYKRCMKSIAVIVLLISLISISSAVVPSAVNDLYKGQCGVKLSVSVPGILGNDIKSTNPLLVKDPGTITIDPKYGTLTVSADGSFVYEPTKTIPSGTYVIFYYKATDGTTVTNQAMVKILVSCSCHGAAPDVSVCPGTKITSEFLTSKGAGCIGCRDSTIKFDLSQIPAQPVAGKSYPYTVTCPDCVSVTGHVIFQGPCTITWVPFTVCSETTPTAAQIKASGKVKCSCADTDPAISDPIRVGNHWEYTITCQSICGPATATGTVNIDASCKPTIGVSFPIPPGNCPNHDLPTPEYIIANGIVSCDCGGTLEISDRHWIKTNDEDPSDWLGEYTATCKSANGCEASDVGQFTSEGCAYCTPFSCDDGNICTDDSCNPATGCVHTANTAPCDDGNACTTPDVCANKVCTPGPQVSCEDGNICTDDSCNPATGCVNTANSAPCDDGNACTTPDVCANKVCKSGAAVDCNDHNVCTDDSCDITGGCQHTPNDKYIECDGIDCTNPDHCINGECTPGPLCVGRCDDNTKCTTDSCVAGIGCVHTNTGCPGQACCSTNGGVCVDKSCSGCGNTCTA
jgi:hypothetical protein